MQYLIARDGKQLGQFSEEEIRSGLFEGRYLSTDVAWTEGMTDWKPLGEIMGQGVTRVAGPVQSSSSSTEDFHMPTAPVRTLGLAIAALVVGILAVLSCGGLGLTAIPAIVCGHMALTRIRQAGGTLGGRGAAVTGLVMGYVSVLLLAVLGVMILFSSLSIGALGKMAEKGQMIDGINDARQLVQAAKIYAADHEGKYPATMEELVTSGVAEQEFFDKANRFKPAGWLGEPGFEYHAAGLKEDVPGNTPLFTSRCWSKEGKRIVAHSDGSSEVVRMPLP